MDDALRFDAFLTDLSTRFAGISSDRIDGEIDRALERLVEVLGTDRATLLEMLPDDRGIVITHSWARPGFEPAARSLSATAGFPWYTERLRKGKMVRFERTLDELPPEARAERAYAAMLPMLSHVAAPIMVDGRWVCALLTATARRYRSWSDADVDRIQIVGQIFASAVHRRALERALCASEERVDLLERRLEIEREQLLDDAPDLGFEGIAGQSPALRKVLAQASLVAPTGASVLLLGETGTGKELLARAIHARSERRNHPLVPVNCAALPESLVESELFGHEKGAFTGATAAKPGRFELADGGTLFLDEIAEIPPEAQVKLLRALEDGTIQRLGAIHPRRVDVRVIAATNRDLERAMADGSFREDLYYRLAVFPIEVPPLRERLEDLPMLVWDLVERRQDPLGRRIARISEGTMQRLGRYSWPGNIRELGNVIERALILSDGPELFIEAELGSERRDAPRSERFLDVERAHYLKVLERCGWRVNGAGNAAEVLGMKPSTLRSRLKKLGVGRPSTPRRGAALTK